ncbi:MAG: LysM peptidoglycan-binding domain-containing protein [Bacteroidales bacterium]|nr:LysM peptidoglycan-binding domain-containing protein [Bacteroidales bacterium]
MQNFIAIIFSILFTFSFSTINAQSAKISKSTEIVQDINGNSYFLHHIHKGETLYAISKAYNVSIEKIELYNKDITDGLKIGNEIKIPIIKETEQTYKSSTIPQDTIAPEGFINHKVKKGETLYSISFNYQVHIDEIKKHNKGLTANIHPGEWILIPSKNTQILEIARAQYDSLVDYKIGWFDNYYRLEKKFKLNQEQLEQINPQLKDQGVRRGLHILVPYIEHKTDTLPKYEEIVLDSIPEEKHIVNDSNIIKNDCPQILFNRHTYKIGLLLPLYAELESEIRIDNEIFIKEIKEYKSFRFIDFYQGALLAIDSLKNLGFKAELYVWDTKGSTTTTDSICQLDNFNNLDIIIGPFYSKNVEIIRQHIDTNAIRLVEIFSQTNLPIDSNTQHFEIRSNNQFKYDAHAKYINDSLPNSKIIIIHSGKPSELKKLAILDSTIFHPEFNIDSSRVSIYRYNNNLSSILKNTSKDSINIFINLVNNEAVISDFLRQLYLLKNDNKEEIEYDIMVMAHNSVWSKYKTLDIKYLDDLRYTYTADYYINYDDTEIIMPYEIKYYNEYKRIPSKLGFIGHDIMWYFGNALFNYGINFSECVQFIDYKTMHNKLVLREVNIGFFRNHSTNLLQYNNYKIEKKN